MTVVSDSLRSTVKIYFESNWKFLLFVLIGGMIGGYCTGIYGYDALSEDALAVLREQHVTREMMAIASMFQYGILFGLVLAAIGIVISGEIHLWKAFRFGKRAMLITASLPLCSAAC
jgi:hypothetical protein